jgi:FkbM family methyltransferase
MYINLEDPRFLGVGYEIINEDIHKILSLFIKKGDTFIDIGANQGAFSMYASTLVGPTGLIISVEPQPQLAHNIHKSLENKSVCKYQVHQMAMGDSNGDIELIVPQSSSGSAGIYHEYSGIDRHNKIKVPLRRFDDSIDWKNLPGFVFLKLDIEGSEYAFIKGAMEMLRTLKPVLYMEINPITLSASGTKVKDLSSIFTNLGYTHYQYLNKLEKFFEIKNLNADVQKNILIVNKYNFRKLV